MVLILSGLLLNVLPVLHRRDAIRGYGFGDEPGLKRNVAPAISTVNTFVVNHHMDTFISVSSDPAVLG